MRLSLAGRNCGSTSGGWKDVQLFLGGGGCDEGGDESGDTDKSEVGLNLHG